MLSVVKFTSQNLNLDYRKHVVQTDHSQKEQQNLEIYRSKAVPEIDELMKLYILDHVYHMKKGQRTFIAVKRHSTVS